MRGAGYVWPTIPTWTISRRARWCSRATRRSKISTPEAERRHHMAKTKAVDTPFTQALREGLDLARELRHWDTPAGRKQTADAMLTDALRRAERTPTDLNDFLSYLDGLPPGFERLPAALRRLEKIVSEPTTTSGHLTRMPRAWVGDDERAAPTPLKM